MDYLKLAQEVLAARNGRDGVAEPQGLPDQPTEEEELSSETPTCEISEICEIRSGEETDPGVERSGEDPLFRTSLRNKCEIRVGEPADPLEPEVRWRYEAMRAQVPPRGDIGFLLARPELADAWRALGTARCHSCGEALPPERRVHLVPRCRSCCLAAELACNQVREA
jgi:hypothetical protein